MLVSAIIVTRGDVDLRSVLYSLPEEWEVLVWDNRAGTVTTWKGSKWGVVAHPVANLSVYGRYAAIAHAANDLIYVQDDDVIVSDPQAIVNEWDRVALRQEQDPAGPPPDSEWGRHVVCNMPPEFRHDFYIDHALVGFGAAFHRDAPERAFRRFFGEDTWPKMGPNWAAVSGPGDGVLREHFNRTCDIVFTALTPRVLVDVPKENLPHAYDDTRMWRQSTHQEERTKMLDLVLKIKEAP